MTNSERLKILQRYILDNGHKPTLELSNTHFRYLVETAAKYEQLKRKS